MDWVEMSKLWVELADQLEVLHRPVHDRLMTRAALQPGERVIDIGFGSGDTLCDALAAVGPEGAVLGLDIAAPMVAHAGARLAPGAPVTLAVGDAQDFAFDPGAADVVISKFGVMFFRDTGAAFGNIRKGLRPGGRMVFAAWGPPQHNPYFALPRRVAVERLGEMPRPEPDAPGPMRFGDADRVIGLLQAAGWAAEVETVDLHLTPPGGPLDLAGAQLRMGPAAIAIREKGASEADRAAIAEALAEAYAGMVEGGAVRVPARIHFFAARVPS